MGAGAFSIAAVWSSDRELVERCRCCERVEGTALNRDGEGEAGRVRRSWREGRESMTGGEGKVMMWSTCF